MAAYELTENDQVYCEAALQQMILMNRGGNPEKMRALQDAGNALRFPVTTAQEYFDMVWLEFASGGTVQELNLLGYVFLRVARELGLKFPDHDA